MSDVLRVGVLGCGGIAQAHLKGIEACEAMELVATADAVAEQAEKAAEAFGARRAHTTSEALFNDPDVEAVHICVPNHLHRDLAVAAARAGKHALVEKPLALSAPDAQQMVDTAEAAGVTLMSGQILRFRTANIEAKRLIAEGRIGKPVNVMRRRITLFKPEVVSSWYANTAVNGNVSIYGTGSHEVDLVLWLLDTEAKRVFAMGRELNPDWGCAEEVLSTLELSDGTIFNYIQSLNTRQGAWDCTVVGDKGSMLIGNDVIDLNGERIECPMTSGGMEEQVAEFGHACLEGREPIASGRNVLATMKALDAIAQSVETGNVIEL